MLVQRSSNLQCKKNYEKLLTPSLEAIKKTLNSSYCIQEVDSIPIINRILTPLRTSKNRQLELKDISPRQELQDKLSSDVVLREFEDCSSAWDDNSVINSSWAPEQLNEDDQSRGLEAKIKKRVCKEESKLKDQLLSLPLTDCFSGILHECENAAWGCCKLGYKYPEFNICPSWRKTWCNILQIESENCRIHLKPFTFYCSKWDEQLWNKWVTLESNCPHDFTLIEDFSAEMPNKINQIHKNLAIIVKSEQQFLEWLNKVSEMLIRGYDKSFNEELKGKDRRERILEADASLIKRICILTYFKNSVEKWIDEKEHLLSQNFTPKNIIAHKEIWI